MAQDENAEPLAHVGETRPDFQPGKPGIGTALVLAAPGRREVAAGHPAAGQTGVNLDGILRHLHLLDPDRFPSVSRHDYRIVNSVAFDLFKGRDQRTMPRPTEVLAPDNLRRLSRLLAGYPTIVAFSSPATLGVRAIGLDPKLVGHHPSMSSLNSLYPGLGGSKRWRVEERYRLFAQDLLALEAAPCPDE